MARAASRSALQEKDEGGGGDGRQITAVAPPTENNFLCPVKIEIFSPQRRNMRRLSLKGMDAGIKRKGDAMLARLRAHGRGGVGHSCHDFPFLPVRGNETGEGHNPAVRKQLRDLSDAADVLHAVFLGEAHVLVEPHADIISVETVLFTSNGQGIWIGNNEERAGAMGFDSCPWRVREKKRKHERALCSEIFLWGGGLKSWVDGGGGLRGSAAEGGMQRGGRGQREVG